MPPSAPDVADFVTIARIGADGDGIAAGTADKPRYFPFTLPGEDVSLATPPVLLTTSIDRVMPPCPHFGTCGGCTLQHWRDEPYAAWKVGLLADALRRAGYGDTPIAPLVRTPPEARRRIDLAIRRHGATLTVGLHKRGSSTEIIDLDTCTILHPVLAALIAPLRHLLRSLATFKREGSAVLNLLDTGPDLLLRTDAPATTGDRARLAAFAAAHGIPRIALAIGKLPPEIASQHRRPSVIFDGTPVTPPPGAFLQASAPAETAIRAAVLAGLPTKLTSKSRFAELYAGNGTLTFDLSNTARVDAFEGDAAAAGALRDGVNAAARAGRIAVHTRDLTRQPLSVKDFAAFAAVILDPPFAGAGPQMATLAASAVKRVIYVSCNPAALAREARMLHDAGFKLLSATPVDQFLWSARLEAVCVFGR